MPKGKKETGISWTDYTLNAFKWFCTRVSPGCKNCYMMTLAERYPQHAADRPVWRGAALFKELKKIPAGKRVFFGSMYDPYHEQNPLKYIHAIHNIVLSRPDLTFQILTKRPERVLGLKDQLAWPENLWLGTSVENEEYLWRLDYLLDIPAAKHFVSAEPLLGSLGPHFAPYLYEQTEFNPALKLLDNGILTASVLRGTWRLRPKLDWVIVGGESGANRRPFSHDWAREIRDMCDEAGVAFFFKQGGDLYPGKDNLLDGLTYAQFPDDPPQKVLQMEMFG